MLYVRLSHYHTKRGLGMGTQIIVITKFSADVGRPTLLARSDELEHAAFVFLGITVYPAEMIPMVLHTAVLLAATGEVETCPSFDFFRLANLSQSVYKS